MWSSGFRLLHLLPWGAVAWAGGGCAPSLPAQEPAQQAGGEKAGARPVGVPPTVVTPHEALSLPELLTRARARMNSGEYEKAARDFERALAADLSDEQRHAVVFDHATALDFAGHPDEALRKYRTLLGAFEGQKRAELRVRLVRLLTYFEDYEEAAELAYSVAPEDLDPLGRVAVFAARGLGRLYAGKLELAERELLRARTVIESEALDRVTTPPLDVAALFYGLGELRRVRAEKITFEPLPDHFAAKLEERAQLVLDAQSAYSQAMRSDNAHWSAMAGVRVGQLYQRLHEDLTAMPLPAEAESLQQKDLLRGALRLRYAILVEKAEKMMRHTLMMLERTEQPSRWKERAKEALEELEEQRKKENAAIDALPYSRATLRGALEDLDQRAGGDGSI